MVSKNLVNLAKRLSVSSSLAEEINSVPQSGNKSSLSGFQVHSEKSFSLPASNFLILPAKDRGELSYPDLLVGLHKFAYNPDLEEVLQYLGIMPQNTANQLDDIQYMGNLSWSEGIKLNLFSGFKTLDLVQFFDFRKLILDGINGEKVFNGAGKKIPDFVLKELYKEIFFKCEPWRSEILDACFHKYGEVMCIASRHCLKDGELNPSINLPLGGYLNKTGCVASYSIGRFGLPVSFSDSKSNSVSMSFWSPEDDRTARFDCSPGWTALYCRNPLNYRSPFMGIRSVLVKGEN